MEVVLKFLQILTYRSVFSSFNPCFDGSGSEILPSTHSLITIGLVSILVLMEVVLKSNTIPEVKKPC